MRPVLESGLTRLEGLTAKDLSRARAMAEDSLEM
jgi:hypothetical protein